MTEGTVGKIEAEQRRQAEKWGATQFVPLEPTRVLAVLVEEVGELAKALLERRPDGSFPEVEAELIQLAAVAASWLDQCFDAR